MGKTQTSRAVLSQEQHDTLSKVKVIEELKEPRGSVFAYSDTDYSSYAHKGVYEKIIKNEWFLAPPENSKKSKAWKQNFKLVLEKGDDGSFQRTGHVIHHANKNNKYCGWDGSSRKMCQNFRYFFTCKKLCNRSIRKFKF